MLSREGGLGHRNIQLPKFWGFLKSVAHMGGGETVFVGLPVLAVCTGQSQKALFIAVELTVGKEGKGGTEDFHACKGELVKYWAGLTRSICMEEERPLGFLTTDRPVVRCSLREGEYFISV